MIHTTISQWYQLAEKNLSALIYLLSELPSRQMWPV
jgi:hypothetical protein